MTNKRIRTRTSEFYIEDGILKGYIHLENAEQTLEDAIEIFDEIERVCEGRAYPMLSDVRKSRGLTRDAREYFAGERAARCIRAAAIIIGSPVTRVLANFLIQISKPKFPTQMFVDEELALAWLEQFVE